MLVITKRNFRFLVYFLFGLLFTVSFVAFALDYDFKDGADFDVSVSNGNSLIFQLGKDMGTFEYPYVYLFADGSDFNCSGCSLEYASDGMGVFDFTMENDCPVEFGFNYDTIDLSLGGSGKLDDGEEIDLSGGVSYRLVWNGCDMVVFNTNVNVAVNALIVMGLLFAPTVALFLIGLGKWSFPVGLTIGAVIGYLFVPMLIGGFVFYDWILYAVVMLDVGVFIAVWKGGF